MTVSVDVEIRQFLESVSARLNPNFVEDADDWLQHDEWDLAIETIANGLFESEVQLGVEEQHALKRIMTALDRPISDFAFLDLGSRT